MTTPETANKVSIQNSGNKAIVAEALFNNYEQRERMLTYLDVYGQEDQIRAVTAIILQGKNYANDDWVFICQERKSEVFNVFGRGYKRLIEPLGEGIARAILYHESMMPKYGMNVLIGGNREEILHEFDKFLEALPLPRLRAISDEPIEDDLFVALFRAGFIVPLTDGAGKINVRGKLRGYYVKDELLHNDYALFREAMIDTAKRHKNVLSDRGSFAALKPANNHFDGGSKAPIEQTSGAEDNGADRQRAVLAALMSGRRDALIPPPANSAVEHSWTDDEELRAASCWEG